MYFFLTRDISTHGTMLCVGLLRPQPVIDSFLLNVFTAHEHIVALGILKENIFVPVSDQLFLDRR